MLLITMRVASQNISLNLFNSFVMPYNKFIYTGGFLDSSGQILKVYKLSPQLVRLDSLQIKTDAPVKNYYPIGADTIHGLLQLTCQKRQTALVKVYRIEGNHNQLPPIEIEIPRLVHSAQHPNTYYTTKDLFVVGTISASDFRRFQLRSFRLKDSLAYFSYESRWHYITDKPGILTLQTLFCTHRSVYAYAIKTFQQKYSGWLLKFNRNNGELEKATKIDLEVEELLQTITDIRIDTLNHRYTIVGQSFKPTDLTIEDSVIHLRSRTPRVYCMQFDSLLEISGFGRLNFIPDPKNSKQYWRSEARIKQVNSMGVELFITFYHTSDINYEVTHAQLVQIDLGTEAAIVIKKIPAPEYEIQSLYKKHPGEFRYQPHPEYPYLLYPKIKSSYIVTGIQANQSFYFFSTQLPKGHVFYKYGLEGKSYKVSTFDSPESIHRNYFSYLNSHYIYSCMPQLISIQRIYQTD